MKFIFPEPKKLLSVDKQLKKVLTEIKEFQVALPGDKNVAAEELIDIYHTVEWLLRSFEHNMSINLKHVFTKVRVKNQKRGYYKS